MELVLSDVLLVHLSLRGLCSPEYRLISVVVYTILGDNWEKHVGQY